MLFNYTYVPHQMEKMQGFIDFIFNEVWCKAPLGLTFSPALFDSEPDYKNIMSDFGFSNVASEKGRGRRFYKETKEIYELFCKLSAGEVNQFQSWYKANNAIEKICLNEAGIEVIRYCELFKLYPVLGKHLAKYFKGLYDIHNLAKIKQLFKGIEDHNTEFFKINSVGICPFCGIKKLRGIHHTRREAYDHYLPKYRYPFNALNFTNLVPACNECNSVYKLSKDPVRKKHPITKNNKQRKTFYPYSTNEYKIDVYLSVDTSDIDSLMPDDIQLSFGPVDIAEEIDTWKDVYGIEERYKAECCNESGGKYWLTQVLDEWREDDRSPDSYLSTLTRQAQRDPFPESNFLKKAFLLGCKDAGLFNIDPSLIKSP
jgi:hypothetical protein